MGANSSKRRAASRDAAPRWESVLGWRKIGDRWEAIDTARALLARRGVLKGRCSTGECGRRVTVDLGWWVEHGLGDLPLSAVTRTYGCSRINCRLSFDAPVYPGGVPLMAYANEKGAEVRVSCSFCGLKRTRTVTAFAEAALKAGSGGPNLPAWNLAGAVRGACPRCERIVWRAYVVVGGVQVGPPPSVSGS